MKKGIEKHIKTIRRILSTLSSYSAFDSTLIQVFHIMESELGFENPKIQILNFSRSLRPIKSKKREEIEMKISTSPTYNIIEIENGKLLISPIRVEGRDIGFISAFISKENKDREKDKGNENVEKAEEKISDTEELSDTFMLDVLSVIGQILGFSFFILAKEKTEVKSIGGIIYKSKKMDEVLKMAIQVAKSDATVLIRGESGVGKELVAEIIHSSSQRKDKPFIKINCAAIPENLLESELFGYKKGAFTGAIIDKKGKFEEAEGGTIFLDEIGDMPLSLQAKLLRVLQSKEIEPIGGKPKKVDVRIIAATNKNLEEMVKKGSFREDLFYRLNVVPIVIPPLRERKEDIKPLVEYFLEKFNKKYGKNISISKGAMRMLEIYHWPGNVRELENLIERLVLTSSDLVITPDDIPDHIKDYIKEEIEKEMGEKSYTPDSIGRTETSESKVSEKYEKIKKYYEESGKTNDLISDVLFSLSDFPFSEKSGFSLPEIIEKIERKHILWAISTSKNISEAARKLGITRRQLEWKMRKYGLTNLNKDVDKNVKK